jgi:spore maturation protein CgeB
MRIALFCHSLVSDWNHGTAHFLRGIVRELRRRAHQVRVFEPRDGWSRENLAQELGRDPSMAFRHAFHDLESAAYDLEAFDLDAALDDADVVLVHEWTDPALIARISRHRVTSGSYSLLFLDTHRRSASARGAVGGLDLDGYDGVLAAGEALRETYARRGWSRRAWTWHEAADLSVFRPHPRDRRDGDLVWIGNWGDDQRAAELQEFLLQPIRTLRLAALFHGVRYPDEAISAVRRAGARYGGYLPNHLVPATYARFDVTIHVPRLRHADALPGLPTIRVFEALACGIPLVCAPWRDSEGLFGRDDFLVARDADEMTRHLRALLSDADMRAKYAANGLASILTRHSCAHRVDQLFDVLHDLAAPATGNDPRLAREVCR